MVVGRARVLERVKADENGMGAALARVWTVFLTVGVVQLANGLQTDLLSVRADQEAFGAGMIGVIMSSYYVGYSTAPLTGRYLVARLGHVRVVILMSVAAAVAIALPPFVISPPAWALFRLLSGFSLASLYIAVESWIHDSVENTARGRVFSAYMVVQLLAMTAAQFLFGAGNPHASLPFLFAAVLFLVSSLPLWRLRKAHHTVPPEPLAIFELFRISPMGAIVTVLAGVSWSIIFTFGPVYARHAGLDVRQTATLMAAAMVGGALMQLPFGWLSDYFGRRSLIAFMSAGAIAAALLGLWADGSGLAGKAIASFFLGGFVFTLYAISVARANDLVAPKKRVAAAAGLILLFGLGSILGPLLSGQAIAILGAGGYFIVLAIAMAACLAATGLRR